MNSFIKTAEFNRKSQQNYVINGVGYRWQELQEYIADMGGTVLQYYCMNARLRRGWCLLDILTKDVHAKFKNKVRASTGPVLAPDIKRALSMDWRR